MANSEREDRSEVDRRTVLRRAAVGVPVLLATVHGRRVWARQNEVAQAGSAPASAAPSA